MLAFLLLLQIVGTIPANQCASVVVSWACAGVQEPPPAKGDAVPAPTFGGLQALPEKTVETVWSVSSPPAGLFRETLGALEPGEYNLRAKFSVEGVGEGQTGLRGYRVCVVGTPWPWSGGRICTETVSGTQTVELSQLGTLPAPERSQVVVEAYNSPTGRVTVEAIALERRAPPPFTMFLRYPNYRGVLEGDEVVVWLDGEATVTLQTPAGDVIDQKTGAGLLTLDASKMGAGWHVVRAKRGSYEYPSYAVMRGSPAIDRGNRFVRDGEAYIPVGVYDSGLGYLGADDARWTSMLEERRRLSELEPGIYINYHYGLAGLNLKGLMDALGQGLMWLPAQCFAHTCADYNLFESNLSAKTPEVLAGLSSHRNWGGVYIADEPSLAGVRTTWPAVTYFRGYPGVTLGILNKPNEFAAWRDSLDAIGVDPYPVFNDPVDLSLVPEWVSGAREAVQDSRPVVAVLQFWLQNSKARWPTQQELEWMGLTAIAEGADGVIFWSIGNGKGALLSGSVCPSATDWCEARVELFDRLKRTMANLRKVPAAVGQTVVDSNTLKAVRKGSRMIVYNKTAQPATADVEGRAITLGPFEAKLL